MADQPTRTRRIAADRVARTVTDQQDRVAIVTGGGRGLGQAIALGLAAHGARVVAVARSTEPAG